MRPSLFLFLLTLLAALRLPAAEARMNVLLLLVDDWGWTDGGVFGSDLYETPRIDQLAAEGTRFTQAYAACTVCSPTRAALLTGQYPARLHLTDWIAGHSSRYQNRPLLEPPWTQKLELTHTTLAERLQAAGYRTASVGKWHLTPTGEPGSPEVRAYWPQHHGFEVNIGGNQFGGPGSYFAPFSPPTGRVLLNMPEADDGDYLTDRLTDEAIRLIRAWQNEPFFLYLPYYAVHTPIQAKPDLIEKYKQKIRPGLRHQNPAYAAMVETVDDSVGRILDTLEALGLTDNTLVILTGDNGGLDPHDTGRITNNAPLRDGKGSVYEGGVRVPCVIRLPHAPSGTVSDQPIISMDLFPTILAAAGLAPDQPETELDGVDLLSLLHDPSVTLPERDLFWHYPHDHTEGATPYSAVRAGDFRLIEYHLDGNVELYNLAEDPGETRDDSRASPDLVYQLKQKLETWRTAIGAQMPPPNPAYDPTQPTLIRKWGQ